MNSAILAANRLQIQASNTSSTVYSPEATAVFALMPTPLTTAEKNIYATAIDAWVAGGHWALLSEIQIYRGLTGVTVEANARKGLKGRADATNQLGTPSYTAGSGFTLVNGISQLRTGFVNTLPLIALNNIVIGGYIITNDDPSNPSRRYLISSVGTSDAALSQEPASARLRHGINSNTESIYSGQSSFANEMGYELARSVSTNQKLYINGVEVSNPAVTSVALFQQPVDIYVTGKVGAMWIGSEVGFNHVTFNTILRNMMSQLSGLSL